MQWRDRHEFRPLRAYAAPTQDMSDIQTHRERSPNSWEYGEDYWPH